MLVALIVVTHPILTSTGVSSDALFSHIRVVSIQLIWVSKCSSYSPTPGNRVFFDIVLSRLGGEVVEETPWHQANFIPNFSQFGLVKGRVGLCLLLGYSFMSKW